MASASNGNESDPSGASEFERFESFARRLLRVPKAEVDKAKKQDQARRLKAKSKT
jgi:hypothetical protein